MNVDNENEKNDSSSDDDPDSLSGDCRRDDDNDSNDNGCINGRDGGDGNSRPVGAEVDLDDDGAASSSEMAHFRARLDEGLLLQPDAEFEALGLSVLASPATSQSGLLFSNI